MLCYECSTTAGRCCFLKMKHVAWFTFYLLLSCFVAIFAGKCSIEAYFFPPFSMSCGTCPKDPKAIYGLCFRVAFGGALLLVGVKHYLDMPGFANEMVAAGFSAPLSHGAKLYAYVLPLLQIVGGGLIVAGKKCDIAAWCVGVALASTTLGLLLKAVVGAADLGGPNGVMGGAQNALLWLTIGAICMMFCCCSKKDACATKEDCCGSGKCDGGGHDHGGGDHGHDHGGGDGGHHEG